MTILVTGGGGFVGGYLLQYLANTSPTRPCFATVSQAGRTALPHAQTRILDVRDAEAVQALLAELQPTEIYHLAGQAFVPRAFENPWETLEINIKGSLNLLEAVRKLALPCRLLMVGSAEAYGATAATEMPLRESAPLRPNNPYGISKAAQDQLSRQYAQTYGLHTIQMRPFTHMGAGQSTRFAAADWAAQIAAAERGQRQPVVSVGNLSSARDFTDVRDVVRAYGLAMQHGQPGDTFNVCTGLAHTMQSVLDTLVGLSQSPLEIRQDPAKMRPSDLPLLVGDYSALHARTGWQPQYGIGQTLESILQAARR
jgi:GDP-4-dehydro-6-deoxy-D-mannose reductase